MSGVVIRASVKLFELGVLTPGGLFLGRRLSSLLIGTVNILIFVYVAVYGL